MRPIIPVLLSAACLWPALAGAAERPPQYVGRAQCAPCHAEQPARWKDPGTIWRCRRRPKAPCCLSIHKAYVESAHGERPDPGACVTPVLVRRKT